MESLIKHYEKLKEQFILSLTGDSQSYEEFLKMLRDNVVRYLGKYQLGFSEQDDIAQDVLISVHLAKHTYDIEKPFGPWLVAIVKRRLIDRFRTSKRFVADSISDHGELFNEMPMSADDKLILEEALSELEPSQLTAIIGTEILGYSTGEIAEHLKVKPSTLRVMLHRTIKHWKDNSKASR